MLLIRLLFILALLSNIGIYIYDRQNTPKKLYFNAVDPGVQKLILLSELDGENTIWEDTAVNEGNQAEVFNQECYSVGAFNSKSEISPIIDILKNDVIKIRTRKVISTQEAGYWVFIPAMKSREEALSIGRQLSQLNIKDYYVVTGGENENTLSLGLYRESRNADARLQELTAKGFNVEKQVRIEQWPEFWLDYTIASDQVASITNINDLVPDVATNKVECTW
ncbi:MAG: SPOR domain-containing protein [Alcanivoracaceae bacterium]|nr:SPOR domain-containing protein [Alcanivoracaceae bacterium]